MAMELQGTWQAGIHWGGSTIKDSFFAVETVNKGAVALHFQHKGNAEPPGGCGSAGRELITPFFSVHVSLGTS